MFWKLLTKIVLDVLAGLLVELVVTTCCTLLENHRRGRKVQVA